MMLKIDFDQPKTLNTAKAILDKIFQSFEDLHGVESLKEKSPEFYDYLMRCKNGSAAIDKFQAGTISKRELKYEILIIKATSFLFVEDLKDYRKTSVDNKSDK